MKRKLVKLAAKLFFKRKVNKMERTLGDVVQLTRLNELIKKNKSNEKLGKILKIVLICTGALVLAAGIGFIVMKVFGRQEDDYDLYDDLDNYYDESDHYDVQLDAQEGDFAE